ncbi:MAG TPA: MFS transporter [Candidatus Limnocylindrales bacterium]
MTRSLYAVLFGTFTLRLSTGLTGGLLVFFLARDIRTDALTLAVLTATFFAAELILSTPFGLLSDRLGHHRIMQVGPVFGVVAVVITWATSDIFIIGATRWLEGASTAASVPSILGYIAMATAGNELLRGRMSARFEGATLAGLGVGFVAAGLLYDGVPGILPGLGRHAFLLNAVIYAVSFVIYRYGVETPSTEAATLRAPHYGWRRYVDLLTRSHVWLLAPTWIAINGALGLWTSQSIFQLISKPAPQFSNQLLMGQFQGAQIALGAGVGLVVFFAGLAYWGDRFRNLRRTTIIFYGILGGAATVVAAVVINHSGGQPDIVRIVFGLMAAIGVFVLAGATPAALGLLADVSEAYPADRGAIMGLYSVFLALGQIGGSFIGGASADRFGIDGILFSTLGLLVVAVVPLARLRAYEHAVGVAPEARGA